MKNFINIFTALLIISQIIISPSARAEENYEKTKQEITVLYNANKIKEAYQLILTIPEDKRDSEIWLIAANITQDYDRNLDAIYLLKKAVNINPKDYKAYYNLGNIYLNENKFNSAIENYKLCLKHNKEFSYAWYNLGIAYLAVDDLQKAKSAFMRAISYNSSNPDFYFNLAYTYKQLNQKKQAEKMLKIYNTLTAEEN